MKFLGDIKISQDIPYLINSKTVETFRSFLLKHKKKLNNKRVEITIKILKKEVTK